MAYEGIRARRPLIMGRRGAVASNHPVATAAGMDILRAGGNAADAAVAVASVDWCVSAKKKAKMSTAAIVTVSKVDDRDDEATFDFIGEIAAV